jgi:hypothetical protein
MGKGVFDQSIDQMLEFDRGLDINSVFESIPAIESEVEEEKTKEETEKKDDTKLSLDNINKVLDSKITETEEETKEEEVVEDKKKDLVEQEKKDDKAPGTNEQATKTSSDAPLIPFTVIFAKDLVDQGLLSSFNEAEFLKEIKEQGDATALRNLIKNEIETNITAAKEDLDTGYQEFLNLTGKGVPAETAGSLLELKTQFDAIKADELAKEENVDLRKKVITDYLKLTTSMSDAKIAKLVQNSVDLGEDVDESKENLATLKNLIGEQIAAEEKEAEHQMSLRKEENRRVLESLKETINTIEEVIPGVAINKQTKTKMFEDLTKEVQDGKGRVTNAVWAKRAEDPVFFDSRLAYLLETGFFEKGKAWNKASQAKTTKEISALETELKNRSASTIGSPVIKTPDQDKTTRDNIESMRGVFGK